MHEMTEKQRLEAWLWGKISDRINGRFSDAIMVDDNDLPGEIYLIGVDAAAEILGVPLLSEPNNSKRFPRKIFFTLGGFKFYAFSGD